MKFHAEKDLARMRVVLRCEVGPDPENRGALLWVTRNGEYHSVWPGNEPPIWDWFPEVAVTPMVEALSPRPVATERHLDDAIEVRDRLLEFVDRVVPVVAGAAFAPVPAPIPIDLGGGHS